MSKVVDKLILEIKPETREKACQAFFMDKALLQAKKAGRKGEVPVGAVIVKDEKIIATGYNKREKSKDATMHAEICAIKKACKKLKDFRLNGCTIYVTLLPCPMCAGAIANARISKLIYGADNENLSFSLINDILKSQSFNHTVEIDGNVLQTECSEILKNFFKNRRKS